MPHLFFFLKLLLQSDLSHFRGRNNDKQAKEGDFYCWLSTTMIENRKIVNTIDGLDKVHGEKLATLEAVLKVFLTTSHDYIPLLAGLYFDTSPGFLVDYDAAFPATPILSQPEAKLLV
ncbi:uncharacterized protein LOC115998406 isoform X1 [Ipomoea triloba]|uniref:uncharacterized protein LOC115998406 isoform X1 n=1 Tax=Ipomoea triloba TaxID=35885 RepID=UPI00125CDF3F|nr:uncharacterized protein LOC115998406 isoform X1 [Ipomoea triloba]